MNNYKFRGKRVNTNNNKLTDFVYGFYYEHEPPLQCITNPNDTIQKSKYYILKTGFADWNMPRGVEYIEVIPETVGQWTGHIDINKLEIYEDDIVESDWGFGSKRPTRVEMDDMYYLDGEGCISDNIKVIGNIHDSKDLVEKYNL